MKTTVEKTIIEKYDSLSSSEKKVADFIASNKKEVINMNVSELAKKCSTSDATIVRTAKHLGYNGYNQLIINLSKDIGKSEIIDSGDVTLNTLQKFFSLEAERINLLADSINLSEIIEIAKILLSANMVHIIAVGNTTPITTDLGFRLERYGIPCTYSQLYEQYLNHISLGKESDAVVAFSRSGHSKQVIRSVEIAHKKHMKIVVITGCYNDELTKYADYTIKINEMTSLFSSIYKPDSHLIEYAINDALVYVIQKVQALSTASNDKLKDKDTIGILLSEFKQ